MDSLVSKTLGSGGRGLSKSIPPWARGYSALSVKGRVDDCRDMVERPVNVRFLLQGRVTVRVGSLDWGLPLRSSVERMLSVSVVVGGTRFGRLSFFNKRESGMGTMQGVPPAEDRNLVQAAIAPSRCQVVKEGDELGVAEGRATTRQIWLSYLTWDL
jgi:hypothetical protein